MLKKIIIQLLFPVIRLWLATWRFKNNVPTHIPGIMLMWHEELFPILKSASHKDWVVITSASKDGDYLVKILSTWGYKIIRGSASSRVKAIHVLRKTIEIAANNKITLGIDGPRGPRRQIKLGMLLAAKKTGVPIFLVRASGHGLRLNKTWDKTFIPYPFARVYIKKSDAIYIDKTLSKQELAILAKQLTAQLNDL